MEVGWDLGKEGKVLIQAGQGRLSDEVTTS